MPLSLVLMLETITGCLSILCENVNFYLFVRLAIKAYNLVSPLQVESKWFQLYYFESSISIVRMGNEHYASYLFFPLGNSHGTWLYISPRKFGFLFSDQIHFAGDALHVISGLGQMICLMEDNIAHLCDYAGTLGADFGFDSENTFFLWNLACLSQ